MLFLSSDFSQTVFFIFFNIPYDLKELRNQLFSIFDLRIKSYKMDVLLFFVLVININCIRNIVVYELYSLPQYCVELRIKRLLFQCNILKRSKRFTNFLYIIAVLILFGSVFSLISIWIVLTSSFNFIFIISWILVY